jgi:hypothetical protein
MTRQFTLLSLIILFPFFLIAQKHMIKGVVMDANTYETLIGATITFGEGKGVITDIDGRYYITVDDGTYHLKVSYVGYLPQELDVILQRPGKPLLPSLLFSPSNSRKNLLHGIFL